MHDYINIIEKYYSLQVVPCAFAIIALSIFLIINKKKKKTISKVCIILILSLSILLFLSSAEFFRDYKNIKNGKYYTIQFQYAEFNTKYHDDYPFLTPIVAVDYKGNEYALNDFVGFPTKAKNGTVTYLKPNGLILDYSSETVEE